MTGIMGEQEEEAIIALSRLQQLVTREERCIRSSRNLDERQTSSIAILDAIETFLLEMDSSNQQVKFEMSTKRVLRNALSSVVTGLGPGHFLFRQRLMDLVSSLTMKPCFMVVLDAIPGAIPVQEDDSVPARKCAEQVLSGLQSVLSIRISKDPSWALPILRCMSIILSLEAGRVKNIFNPTIVDDYEKLPETFVRISIDSMPTVPDEDLPSIMNLVFKHASGEDQIRKLLIAYQNKLRIKTGDTIFLLDVVQVLLEIFHENKTNKDTEINVTEVYLQLLSTIVGNHKIGNFERSSLSREEARYSQFVIVDLVVLLSLRSDPNYSDRIETLLDNLLIHSIFPWTALSTLIGVVTTSPDKISTGTGNEQKVVFAIKDISLFERINLLEKGLVDLFEFLLLSPLRLSWTGSLKHLQWILDVAKKFLLRFYQSTDQSIRTEIIRKLLKISGEIASYTRSRSKATRSLPIHSLNTSSSDEHASIVVCTSIQDILVNIVKLDAKIFLPFEDTLMEHLKAAPYSSVPVKQACVLLSFLVLSEKTNEACSNYDQCNGINPTNVVTTTWRFLSPQSLNNSVLVAKEGGGEYEYRKEQTIRGILLGTELVRRGKLCPDTQTDFLHWVSRIVLPQERCRFHPEIGSTALCFLTVLRKHYRKHQNPSTLHFDSKLLNEAKVFKVVTTLLTNTGLIRELTTYKAKSRRSLEYKHRPKLFSWDSSRPKTVRNMVLCCGSFSANSLKWSPLDWKPTSQWIFDLLDTYLAMGRQKPQTPSSSKAGWVPYGWVEAIIEIPLFNLPELIPKSKRQKLALDWLKSFMDENELALRLPETYKNVTEKDLCDLLTNMTESNELNTLFKTNLHVAHSLIVGMASAAAILKNSFEHFQITSSSTLVKGNGLRMLQYQLSKIFDMEQKCKSLESVFRAMKLVSRRQTVRPTGKSRKRKQRVTEPWDDSSLVSYHT